MPTNLEVDVFLAKYAKSWPVLEVTGELDAPNKPFLYVRRSDERLDKVDVTKCTVEEWSPCKYLEHAIDILENSMFSRITNILTQKEYKYKINKWKDNDYYVEYLTATGMEVGPDKPSMSEAISYAVYNFLNDEDIQITLRLLNQ